ncbi:hypothetical protein L1987_19171 [Smallanthus sonchifolius]|uniref:Uncharacterized protein n=1 Tax=Smallanthus sonchifolius TaxID=185202 RepID=A0ACB9J2S1_9ASTR|nr:hypothetical protein L1987_19171 [Smallanthus sonchifolius]
MNPSNGGIPPQNSPPGRPPDPSLNAVEERVHPPLIGEPILGAALPRFEANEGEKSAGTSASTPILVTEVLATSPSTADLYDAPKSRRTPMTRRGTPYAKPERGGPIRSAGNRASQKGTPHTRYSPTLDDLRVSEFIRETAAISPMEVPLSQKIPQPDVTSNPVNRQVVCNRFNHEGPGENGSAVGGLVHPQSLDATWKPGEVEKGVQSLCQDGPGEEGKPCQAMNSDLQTAMDCTGGKSPSMHQDQFQAVQSVWNSPLSVGNDEGGKQKCVDPAAGQLRAAPAANQFRTAPAADHVSNTQNAGPGTVPGPSPYKPMNVSTGFNYARAVQGGKGGRSQHQIPHPVDANCAETRPSSHSSTPLVPSINSASPSSSMDIDTSNRFSVLDIPNSIKFNKLVESHGDLYPQDQGLVDGMDVDKSRSKCRNTEVCQLNREHEVRSRILPESITSPPKLGERSSSLLLGPGCSGKNYGISDDQKKNIATRLNNEGSISVDIVDQWCPGQWDYFNDLCTLMGLDPDYCIEDVESDDENGTAQFFAAQMKVGMPKVPFPNTNYPS